MPRIIIRDYPKDTTEVHIRELCRKIGKVEDVYIPGATVTGIVRKFAIVNINCPDEIILKYIKALNGSLWNGNRISIELAKEFYKDKLQRETQEQNADALNPAAHIKYALWKASFINLRVKANAPCVRISTVPGEKTKGVISCGWKGFDKKVVKRETVAPIKSVKSENGNNDVVSKASVCVVKSVEGGGLRKGFGNIIITTATEKKTIDCCVEDKPGVDENDFGDLDHIDSRYEEVHSEPCIAAADLEESVLQRERDRAMSLLNQILGISTESIQQQTETNVVSENFQSVKSNGAVKSDSWNSAVIKRFDPTKLTVSNKMCNEGNRDLTNENCAQLDKLKDIFFKEGGVGWNETKQDSEIRLTSEGKANDSLFLEAEKHGFDVRSQNPANENSVMFNFFDDTDPVQPVLLKEKSIDVTHGTAEIINGNSVNPFGKRVLLSPLSLNEVKELSFKFCRIASIESLKTQWEESKEKLSLDYKKKARESKKKGIAKSLSVESSIVAPNVHRKKVTHGKSVRGGARHSKKKLISQ